MAEDEVIKHVKKVYKIWNLKHHSFWHKLKEIFIEILIIVFAVSLSIWFHNRSEHSHQQKETKEFLLGLREDLVNDINEIAGDKKSYQMQKNLFSYITGIKMNDSLHADSLQKYRQWLFNTTGLNPNNGRFEGFKSSGKIGTIENSALQNDIMDLYQENIPALLASTNAYVSEKKKLFTYLEKNTKRITDSVSNLLTILTNDEARNICFALSSPDEILNRYDICIDKMKSIISTIEKQYLVN